MMLSNRLWSFEQHLAHLQSKIGSLDKADPLTVDEVYMLERLIIQLQLNWDHFVRSVVLDSATGKFLNGNGVVRANLPNPPRSREAAAHRLISLYPNRSFEPDWYLPQQAIDAASRLQLSNFADLSAFLGVAPWTIEELRHLRNFIAHRSKRSALTLRGVISSRSLDGTALTAHCFSFASGGAKTYVRWIAFMKAVARGMVV